MERTGVLAAGRAIAYSGPLTSEHIMRQQAVRHRAIFLSVTVCLACAWLPASAAPAAAATTVATTSVTTLATAEPASLAAPPAEIREHIGPDVSDRGGPFAAGCVSLQGEAHSRFAGARIEGDTAQVTIERGGIAHYFDRLDYRRRNGHWVHVPAPVLPASPTLPPG